jgi:uncharacterized protein with GYD domain
MATYVSLIKWTEKGIANVKDSPSRLDAAKKLYRSHGAELKEFFLVSGQYDMVIVAEAPNDEVIAKLALTLGAQGNIRTETVRAYNEEEYRKIVGSLP